MIELCCEYLSDIDKSLQSINWVVSAATGLFPFNEALINFVHFCLNIQIFCQIFKYFALFLPFLTFLCPFLPFLSKIARMPLLSMKGPAKKLTTHVNFVILYKKVSSIKFQFDNTKAIYSVIFVLGEITKEGQNHRF